MSVLLSNCKLHKSVMLQAECGLRSGGDVGKRKEKREKAKVSIYAEEEGLIGSEEVRFIVNHTTIAAVARDVSLTLPMRGHTIV